MKHPILLFVMLVVLCCSSCLKEPEPPFQVGTNIWPGYGLFYLARVLGYSDGTAIKLVEYPSSSEVIRAFRNNSIEAAALTMDEVFYLAEQQRNPRVVLVTDISNGGDVIVAKPEFRDLQSLRGRKIGVESTALGAFVLSRALEYLKHFPEEAARHMAKREGTTPEQFLQSLTLLKIPDLEKNRQMLGESSHDFHENLRKLAAIMLEKNLIASELDPRD